MSEKLLKKNILGIILYRVGITGLILVIIFFLLFLIYFKFDFVKIINSSEFLRQFLFLIAYIVFDLLVIYLGRKISKTEKTKNTKIIFIILTLCLISFASFIIIYLSKDLGYKYHYEYLMKKNIICGKEGEKIYVGRECCYGLRSIQVCQNISSGDIVCTGAWICCNCGNGICEHPENTRTCPEDCK